VALRRAYCRIEGRRVAVAEALAAPARTGGARRNGVSQRRAVISITWMQKTARA
jgi:hypothetical protein